MLLVACVACVAEVVATLCEWLYQLRAGVFVECGACCDATFVVTHY